MSVGFHNFSSFQFWLRLIPFFSHFHSLSSPLLHSFCCSSQPALMRIHHLAFSVLWLPLIPPPCLAFVVVVRLDSFFAICLPCRAVYLINYFKDLRPFSLLINLSKVQIKIVFQGSSMSFAGIFFLYSLFCSPFASVSGCCCCCSGCCCCCFF